MKSRSVVKPPASTVKRSKTRRAFSGLGCEVSKAKPAWITRRWLSPANRRSGHWSAGIRSSSRRADQAVNRSSDFNNSVSFSGGTFCPARTSASQARRQTARSLSLNRPINASRVSSSRVEAHQFSGFRANLLVFGPGQRREQFGGRRGAVQLHQVQGPRAVAPGLAPLWATPTIEGPQSCAQLGFRGGDPLTAPGLGQLRLANHCGSSPCPSPWLRAAVCPSSGCDTNLPPGPGRR